MASKGSTGFGVFLTAHIFLSMERRWVASFAVCWSGNVGDSQVGKRWGISPASKCSGHVNNMSLFTLMGVPLFLLLAECSTFHTRGVLIWLQKLIRPVLFDL